MRTLTAILMTIVFAGAVAAQDLFVVSGVRIDATAPDTLQAQEIALREGQTAATRTLIDRLTLAEDRTGYPSASESAGLISGLQITDEQRSGTRYLAEITVRFDARAVRRWLTERSIPFVETPSLPTLVIPVLQTADGPVLWRDNPWLAAWRAQSFRNALTPLITPDGPAGAGHIDAGTAAVMNESALRAAAASQGVSRVAVIIARGGGDAVRYDGAIYSFSADGGVQRETLPTIAAAGGYEDAARRFARDLEDAWKRAAIVRTTEANSLSVTILYNGISEWRRLQSAVTGASLVTSAQLDAVSRDGAVMTVGFRGSPEQLTRELDARGAVFRRDPDLGWTVRSR